jgi:hypothetical protein
MFQRDISECEVEYVILNGEIIEEYLDDKPYPSYLVYGAYNNLPLHVVYAKYDNKIIVITAYRPSLDKWQNNFKIRKV